MVGLLAALTVLCIGDSITINNSYCNQSVHTTINIAESGTQTVWWLDPDVHATRIIPALAAQPVDVVSIFLSTNDAAGGVDPLQVEANLRALVAMLESEGVRDIVISIPPHFQDEENFPFYAVYNDRFDQIDTLIMGIAADRDNAVRFGVDWRTLDLPYPDVWWDPVHPLAEGHAIATPFMDDAFNPPPGILDWVTVGGAGNPADSNGWGAVDYQYRIGRFEVSNVQYTKFLNSVAATDTHGLYNSLRTFGFGGIERSGVSGSFEYSARAGKEKWPVNYVTFWDALRFANWKHNREPKGAQDDTTTEDGAYTITAQGIADNSITRSAGARFFIPSIDEWHKAAYYDESSMSYFEYPAQTDTPTVCSPPALTANTANCDDVAQIPTQVGYYFGSGSPPGTFDQGGNVSEWTDNLDLSNPGMRRGRGGGFLDNAVNLSSGASLSNLPDIRAVDRGFRLAGRPVAAPALGPFGIAILLSLLGATAYWRLRDAAPLSAPAS